MCLVIACSYIYEHCVLLVQCTTIVNIFTNLYVFVYFSKSKKLFSPYIDCDTVTVLVYYTEHTVFLFWPVCLWYTHWIYRINISINFGSQCSLNTVQATNLYNRFFRSIFGIYLYQLCRPVFYTVCSLVVYIFFLIFRFTTYIHIGMYIVQLPTTRHLGYNDKTYWYILASDE